jgi:hypothetical protein
MFFDFKSIGGPLFIAKQNLLSRTSVAINASNAEGNQGKILNDGIYLPTSTLLQAGGNAIGLHLNKQGLNPFIFDKENIGYNKIMKPFISTNEKKEYGRLVELTNEKLSLTSTQSQNLFKYSGGPNSVLGIGKTKIRRFSNTTEDRNYTVGKFSFNKPAENVPSDLIPRDPNLAELSSGGDVNTTPIKGFYKPSKYVNLRDGKLLIPIDHQKFLGVSPLYASLFPESQGKLKEGWVQNNVGNGLEDKYRPNRYNKPSQENPTIQEDFRTKSDDPKTSSFRLDYSGGDAKNIEQRVGLGNPGKKKTREELANYQKGLGELDKVNSLRLYKSETVTSNPEKNDLVKFRIGIIQNDDPSEKVFIHFRAFLDSMSDDYSADWTSDKLMGRGENFYRYNGFDRKISLGWTVVAQSKDELIPMYQKLNYLASTLAPDYSKNIGYMRGNLATLTVGGYLYEQPGIITGLSYSVPEESPWEIGIPAKGGADPDNPEFKSDKSVKEMPHMIKVSGFNFIPIHEFVPRTQQNRYLGKDGSLSKFGKERYISLNNGYNNNYDGVNYIK